MALPTLGVKTSNYFPMSILSWNCRGGAHPDFMSNIEDMVTQKKPILIFILETRLPASRVEDLKTALRYDSAHGVDANGLSGGIWMIWDSLKVSVDILPHSNQAIHALIQEVALQDSTSKDGPCVPGS